MSSTKKVVIIFGSILLASILGMAVTLGILVGNKGNIKSFGDIFQGYGSVINESSDIDLTGISAVRIEATSSDIHIVPSNVAKVELKGTVISGKQENYLSVSEQDGTLLISVEDEKNWSLFNMFSIFTDLDLTVYLPSDNMLDAAVHCTSGNIDMTGMRFGNVELRRTSGNMSVRDCTAESFLSDVTSGDTKIESSALGSIRLTCRSGNTTVSGTTGSIYARATSGNIDIAGAAGAIDVGCTSGDISIDVAAGTVPTITAGLTSGNIRIYMPSNAAFDIEARTTSGNISSDLDIAVSGSLNNSFVGENISGKCNGGGPLVSITVTSGNISIIGK